MNLNASCAIAKSIGDVVVTRKDENLTGLKLLVVQPLTPEREPAGRPLVAADAVGAGVGEMCSSCAARKRAFRSIRSKPPVDAGIVGIVDHWDRRIARLHADCAAVIGTVVATQKHRSSRARSCCSCSR